MQLTFRALLAGCLLGAMVAMVNLYFGFQTGWNLSGGLITAIIAYGLFSRWSLSAPYTVFENNISQTAGSAASSAVTTMGAIAVLPALAMMGVKLSISQLYIWAFSIGFLGIFFIIPLREQMIKVEALRFPSGTVAAETILAMHEDAIRSPESTQGVEMSRARVLLLWAVFSAVFSLASYFIPTLEKPPWFENIGLSGWSALGFYLYLNPMMVGAGMIIGPRVIFSLLLGAIIAWGWIAPAITSAGFTTATLGDYRHGVSGWLVWPGVSLMITDAGIALGLTVMMVMKNRFGRNLFKNSFEDLMQPAWWWCGLGVCIFTTTWVMHHFFHISPSLTLLAVLLSFFLSVIATRASGETDINPLGGIGKVTQLVFGMVAPHSPITNLMAAGVAAAAGTSSADMMQDFKTGYLLGAQPRGQLIAQGIGLTVGLVVSVPLYKLFETVYDLGSPEMPAPAAHAWHALSILMANGFKALPAHVPLAISIGAILGIALSLMKWFPAVKPWIPNVMALGLGFIVLPSVSLAMAMGTLIGISWEWVAKTDAKRLGMLVASGLIVGDGLMGIVKAGLTWWKIG